MMKKRKDGGEVEGAEEAGMEAASKCAMEELLLAEPESQTLDRQSDCGKSDSTSPGRNCLPLRLITSHRLKLC